jgi:hypothetical protein
MTNCKDAKCSRKHGPEVDLSSKIPVTKTPFIYSKTEELVWKWK